MDGAPRDPPEVRYFANGVLIGRSTTPPTFDLTWDMSTVVTPTEEVQSQDYTLAANADDGYLGTGMTSQPVNIHVTWEEKEVPIVEAIVDEGRENWWVIVILIGLAIGLLVLLILLIRTRGELARKVIRKGHPYHYRRAQGRHQTVGRSAAARAGQTGRHPGGQHRERVPPCCSGGQGRARSAVL
jgi:hypothetical protein